MPTLIAEPKLIPAVGNKPKQIREYVGRAHTQTETLSIAHMISPPGWAEPGQRPAFDEYTVVLKGLLQVESEQETFRVTAGQAIIAHAGEWVRYSTPEADGAEYLAICLPAFSVESVHRDSP